MNRPVSMGERSNIDLLLESSSPLFQVLLVGTFTLVVHQIWRKYRDAKSAIWPFGARPSSDIKAEFPPPGPPWAEFGHEARKFGLARNSKAWCQKYGNLTCLRSPLPTWLLPHIVLVGDVAVAKQLLVQESSPKPSGVRRFVSRNAQVQWVTQQGEGRSLTGLSAHDPEWKWRKTAWLQQFHSKRFAELNLLGKIVQYGLDFTDLLHPLIDQVVRVDELTTQVALRVIVFFIFGRDIDVHVALWRESAYQMLQHVIYCYNNFLLHWLLRFIPYSFWWKMEQRRNQAWKAVDEVTEPEVRAVLSELQAQKWSRKPNCALATLLQTTPQFLPHRESVALSSPSWKQLLADLRVVCLAGFETTAHSLAFALALLANHPEIADEVAPQGRQVWDLLTSNDTVKIGQALANAPLAKHVFLETLRLFPPVPILPGSILADLPVTTSQGETYVLPRGSNVLFLNDVLNRQTHQGDDFDPYRWDSATKDSSFITPFSNAFHTGPHACPGKPLALLEAHVVLLLVTTRYVFEWTEQSSWDVCDHVLLKPLHGMPLRLRRRQWE